MKKNITIHDLAKLLNIDSSTVSRALNDSPRVGEATRAKIKKLAKEMGYQRNMLASNLRNSKTKTIGVVVPFISRHFFSEAISGIEQAATARGYRVIISQSHDNAELEDEITTGLFMNRVDGLLISPSLARYDGKYLNVFFENQIPVVLFDRYYKGAKVNKVILEDENAAFQATEHLIENGCKRIMHITGNFTATIYENRLTGYKNALKEYNIKYDKNLVKHISMHPDAATDLIKEVVNSKKELPDAIFCANDVTAIAIIKYLTEETDIKIPEDIAIVGFSNEPASDIIKPGLTTIDQHSSDMGKIAAEMLLGFIENKNDFFSSQTITIHSKLIVRASSVKKNALEAK